MFDCIERKDILGQMTVTINTTTKDWDRLIETGLWDKVADVLNNEPKSLEERVSNLEAEVKKLKQGGKPINEEIRADSRVKN